MAEFSGALAHHMAVHIVAMNLAAPLMVLLWRTIDQGSERSWSRWLWPATTLQFALLLGWHLPAVLNFAFASSTALVVMHLSLFLAALWFWLAVVDAAEKAAWNALAALLVTGKIFCLVGVLLTFAPRPIYAIAGTHGSSALLPADLVADQQLAGLLMLIACPLAYVLAGIIVAARWLSAIDKAPEAGVGQRAS